MQVCSGRVTLAPADYDRCGWCVPRVGGRVSGSRRLSQRSLRVAGWALDPNAERAPSCNGTAVTVTKMFVNKRQKQSRPTAVGHGGIGGPQRLLQAPRPKLKPQTAQSTAVPASPQRNALDWDDVSLSSEDSKTFERFLKKSIDENRSKKPAASTEHVKNKDTTADPGFGRPKTSRSIADRSSQKTEVLSKFQGSSAVDRLAMIEARFKNRQRTTPINKASLSASDFDPNVSSDLEIKKQVGMTDISLRKKLEKKNSEKSAPSRSDQLFLVMDGASSSDESTGKRNKFIKANAASVYSDEESSEEVPVPEKMKKHQKTPEASQIMRVHTSTDLEDSEASLRRYMKNLDEEFDRPPSSKKVTFASDLVRSSDYEQTEPSLDDFLSRSETSLDEILPSKMHNIMTLDDLQLGEDKDDNYSAGIAALSNAPSLDIEGLHTVDELLPVSNDLRSSSEYAISMEEDIENSSKDDSTSSGDKKDIMLQLRSVDDLGLDLEPSKPDKKASAFAAQAVESQSDGVKTESESYSEDFHSDDDTLKDTESISHDVTSASTVSVAESEDDSVAEKRAKEISSHSSFSYSSDKSSSTIEPPKQVRKPRKKVASAEVQTDITPGAFLPGSVYTDPGAFRPTKLIDNEALDILTSYNPATLAIQDLLNQQVSLTKEFVSRSRRLHHLAVSAIPCDYVYGEIDHVALGRLKKIMDEPNELSLQPTTS